MFCENCGAQLEDGSKFCTECGSPVNYDETVSPVSNAPQNTAPSGKSSGKNMLVPIIISVSMAVIVALAIVAFFFVRKGFDKIKNEVTGYETLSDDKEEETEPEKPASNDDDEEDYDNNEDEFVSLNEADDDEDDFVSLFDDDKIVFRLYVALINCFRIGSILCFIIIK